MKTLARLVVVSGLSCLIGFTAYALVSWLGRKEGLGSDWKTVMFWGGQAYFLGGVPTNLIVFWAVKKWHAQQRGRLPIFLSPLLGGCLGIVPTVLMASWWDYGRFMHFVTTLEGIAFTAFFSTAGAVFGIGWNR